MEEWTFMIDLVSNAGFPIFISVYLLNRMEKKLDLMIEAINRLTINKN